MNESKRQLRKYKIIMGLCATPFLALTGFALFTAIIEAINPPSSVITFSFSETVILIFVVFGYSFWWLWLICLVVFLYAAIKAYQLRKELSKEPNP